MSEKKTKIIIDSSGDFRVVPISKEEDKRCKKHFKNRNNKKAEDQSGRIAGNWFRD